MERIRRLSLLLVALSVAAAAPAPPAAADAASDAARWLVSRQRPSGDLPSYGGSGVGEIVLALLAGGETGEPVDRALSFIRARGPEVAKSPAHASRVVMALVAAGGDPRSPVDYVARIEDGYDEATGAWEENVYADALAALGVLAAGQNLPGRAVTYLRAQQCPMGGFAWRAACVGPPDVDTTAMVMSALLASGLPPSDTTVSRARSYLDGVQNEDGGFGLEEGNPTNANSTGLALSAIAALGEEPESGAWRTPAGADPLAALRRLQHGSGGFRYVADAAEPQDYATVQALPGVRGIAYPMTHTDRPAPAAGATSLGDPSGPADTGSAQAARVAAATTAPSPRGVHRAGVIVGAGERTRSFCVAFDEPEISGEELLRRTGLHLEVSRTALGAAVCSVDGTGCRAGDCFCRYPTFWGYWTLEGGSREWIFSERGAAERTVTDGSVDAWVWGTDGKPPPPATTADDVCAAAAAAPSDDVTPAATPDADDEADGSPVAAMASFAGVAAVLASAGALVVWRRAGAKRKRERRRP